MALVRHPTTHKSSYSLFIQFHCLFRLWNVRTNIRVPLLIRFRHRVARIYYRLIFFQYLFHKSIHQLSWSLIIPLLGYNFKLAKVRSRHRRFDDCKVQGKSLSRCLSYQITMDPLWDQGPKGGPWSQRGVPKGGRTRQFSLRTPHLSDPHNPPQRAHRPLFEAGYLLISFQALMRKLLWPITITVMHI